VAFEAQLRLAREWAVTGSLSDTTARAYRAGMASFFEWHARASGGREAPSAEVALDRSLTAFAHALLQESGGARGARQKVVNARCGLVAFMALPAGALPLSARALRAWTREAPVESYPPLPFAALLVVARQLWLRGERQCAAGVVLAFAALLRVGELVAMRVEDAAEAGDQRLIGVAAAGEGGLYLARTKTGPDQHAAVPAWAGAALRYLLSQSPAGGPLLGVSARSFRASLATALADIGLGGCGFVPHSLRHGGAVWRYSQGDSAEAIMIAGRWRSVETLRIYLALGRGRLLAAALPSAVATAAAALQAAGGVTAALGGAA
jgi:integrase